MGPDKAVAFFTILTDTLLPPQLSPVRVRTRQQLKCFYKTFLFLFRLSVDQFCVANQHLQSQHQYDTTDTNTTDSNNNNNNNTTWC